MVYAEYDLVKLLLAILSSIPLFTVWFWEYRMWNAYRKSKLRSVDMEETRGLNTSIELNDRFE